MFRKEGKVIIMGDFNSRIGNLDSIVQDNENFYNFKRNVSDHSPIGESYTRGQQLILTFNAANMVVLNGVDSGGGFTFKNTEDKKSMIDYIVVSDNIILPTLPSTSTPNTNSHF